MTQRDSLSSKDHRNEPGSFGIGDFLYLCACIFGPLLTVFWGTQAILSVANALQDNNKYEHAGTFAYFLYYLDENRFTDDICIFILVAAEMLIYIALYRRAEKGITHWGSICYLFIMMVLHVIVWVHANIIPSPELHYDETTEAVREYIFVAKMTVLPAVLYAVSYILCVRKAKLQVKMPGNNLSS